MTLALALLVSVASGAPQSAQPAAMPPPQAAAAPARPASSGSGAAAIDDGLKAFKLRRFAQAEADFERAVQAEPNSAAAHFYLGYVAYKRGEPALRMNEHKVKARTEFARAFELDPVFRPVWGSKK